jgi:Cof subfamily protein (haloacid dehalogenase superfamily)
VTGLRPSSTSGGRGSKPRLVATDLDGTLLHTDGTVTERTRSVLTALDDLGVPVVFTTGRPIRWMEALWADVGGHGLAICSNGGIVYDVAQHEVVQARTIDVGTVVTVGRLLRLAIPGTTFALEKTTGFAREEAFMPRLNVNATRDIPLGELESIADETVVKLLARHEEIAPEAFWEQAEEVIGHLVTTTWSSVGALVEMSAVGVTKATTLAMLAAELGVGPDEVIAFGDMPNDLPLLEWAGTSYAMANAHSTVLALADHVAPRNDEDGVAAVLTEVFDLSVG